MKEWKKQAEESQENTEKTVAKKEEVPYNGLTR